MIIVALTATAGGVGAVARFVLDGLIQRRHSFRFPVETMIINVSGSLLLGCFLGGYTTFSTASLETVRLLQERRWLSGLINGLGMLVVAIAATAVGLTLGLLA